MRKTVLLFIGVLIALLLSACVSSIDDALPYASLPVITVVVYLALLALLDSFTPHYHLNTGSNSPVSLVRWNRILNL